MLECVYFSRKKKNKIKPIDSIKMLNNGNDIIHALNGFRLFPYQNRFSFFVIFSK